MARTVLFQTLKSAGSIALAAGGIALSAYSHSDRQPSRSEILAEGLRVFRKPGKIQGGASCATCHSPDGIEIAAYKFDDVDILRRAGSHLDPSDCAELVQYFHALREKLQLKKLRDPNSSRPLQPGGGVLPGATPAERDIAFGKELQPRLPLLFRGRIENLDQAKTAERQILSIPVTNLKIGIPLNRLSEDVAHGNEHSSIAQWLPEEPPQIPADRLQDWYAAEDKYLANPTPEALHGLILLHLQLANTSRLVGFSAISTAKYRALLVLQDRMRHGTESKPLDLTPDVASFGNFNPIWEVGEFARTMMGRNAAQLGMNQEESQKKQAGPALDAQLHDLRASWFWAGWLSDQGMFKTSHDDKTRLGMWFSESLSKDGPYPIHNVFANARRQAVVSNDLASWGEPMARRRRIWDFAGLRAFGAYLTDLPKEEGHRDLYTTFLDNCFRMNLFLELAEIRATHTVWIRKNSKSNVDQMVDFIKTQDPNDKNVEELHKQLFDAIDSAPTERLR